jgi:hypothetical protein
VHGFGCSLSVTSRIWQPVRLSQHGEEPDGLTSCAIWPG